MSLFNRSLVNTFPLRQVLNRRFASTDAPNKVKILVVGGGTGGLTVANQIYNKFKREGKGLADGDIAILDNAHYHYYQPGWTLVGGGLKANTSKQGAAPCVNYSKAINTNIGERCLIFTQILICHDNSRKNHFLRCFDSCCWYTN